MNQVDSALSNSSGAAAQLANGKAKCWLSVQSWPLWSMIVTRCDLFGASELLSFESALVGPDCCRVAEVR